MNEEAKARKELQTRKDEKQVEFFESAKNLNEVLIEKAQVVIKKTERENQAAIRKNRGDLMALISQYWQPSDLVVESVPMDKKGVIQLIFSVNPSDKMYDPLMTMLALMKSAPSKDNLKMGLEIAFMHYEIDVELLDDTQDTDHPSMQSE